MKKRKVIIPIVCVAVIAAGAGLFLQSRSAALTASGGSFTQTEAVAKQDLQNYITASGTIESGDITKVYSSLVYPVESVNVEVGDMVKKGDLLCVIDTEELEQKISEQEAAIASSNQSTEYTISDAEKAYNDAVAALEAGENTQIINAQNSLDNAKSALDTAQKNYDDALATQGTDKDTQMRSAKMSVENAEKAVETAKEGVTDAEEAVKEAEEALKKAQDEQKSEDYYSMKNVTEAYEEAQENHQKSRSSSGSADIEAAYNDYQNKLREYLNWTYGNNNGNLSEIEIQSGTAKAQQAVTAAEQKITELEAKYDIEDAEDAYKEATEAYVKAKEQIDNANQTAVENAEKGVENAKKGVETAKRQVESAETQLDSAKLQLESVTDGNSKGLDNYKEQLENAQIAYNKANFSYDLTVKSVNDNIANLKTQADRAKSRNTNNSAEVTLQNLKDQLAEATITAPSDGMITYENVAEGVEPSPTAVLFTIEDPNDLIIDVSISEYDMPSISTDMKCEIVPNAMTDLKYDGIIRSIDPTAAKNATGDDAGSAAFKATIAVTSTDTKMLIGMTARVNIITEEEKGVLTVSSDLINKDDQGSYVFAAVKDGEIYKAKKIYVTPGMETSFYVAITPVTEGDTDLTEGTLLLTNTIGITEGQTISIAPQGGAGGRVGSVGDTENFRDMGGMGPGGPPPGM
jgi:RND family efflux transporter MFP subunit